MSMDLSFPASSLPPTSPMSQPAEALKRESAMPSEEARVVSSERLSPRDSQLSEPPKIGWLKAGAVTAVETGALALAASQAPMAITMEVWRQTLSQVQGRLMGTPDSSAIEATERLVATTPGMVGYGVASGLQYAILNKIESILSWKVPYLGWGLSDDTARGMQSVPVFFDCPASVEGRHPLEGCQVATLKEKTVPLIGAIADFKKEHPDAITPGPSLWNLRDIAITMVASTTISRFSQVVASGICAVGSGLSSVGSCLGGLLGRAQEVSPAAPALPSSVLRTVTSVGMEIAAQAAAYYSNPGAYGSGVFLGATVYGPMKFVNEQTMRMKAEDLENERALKEQRPPRPLPPSRPMPTAIGQEIALGKRSLIQLGAFKALGQGAPIAASHLLGATGNPYASTMGVCIGSAGSFCEGLAFGQFLSSKLNYTVLNQVERLGSTYRDAGFLGLVLLNTSGFALASGLPTLLGSALRSASDMVQSLPEQASAHPWLYGGVAALTASYLVYRAVAGRSGAKAAASSQVPETT